MSFQNIILKFLNGLSLKTKIRSICEKCTFLSLPVFWWFCNSHYHDHSLILPTTGGRPCLGAAKLWALLSWVMWGHIGSPKAISSSLHVYWWRPSLHLVSNGLHSVVSVAHQPCFSYTIYCSVFFHISYNIFPTSAGASLLIDVLASGGFSSSLAPKPFASQGKLHLL